MNNELDGSVNPFAAHQQLLRERLHYLLKILHPLLYRDVVRALEANGKLLFKQNQYPQTDINFPEPQNPALPAGVWSLLTLLVAQHISPDIDLLVASGVAVAIECYVGTKFIECSETHEP